LPAHCYAGTSHCFLGNLTFGDLFRVPASAFPGISVAKVKAIIVPIIKIIIL